MFKKLLGAAAMAASVYAFVPAHAAHFGIGCTGENQAKTEGAVEAMPDGPGKFMAQREIAQAQDAMPQRQHERCAMHLTQAMTDGQPDPGSVRQRAGPGSGRNHATSPAPTAAGTETVAI